MGSTDDADGADGIFSTRAHPDHSRPCPAFTRERDLDAQRPEERLRPSQQTGERPRIFCPCRAARDVSASTLRTQTQEVGRAPGPHGPVGHDFTHASSYGIGLDDALDSRSAICRVGASERAGRPECCFTSRGPRARSRPCAAADRAERDPSPAAHAPPRRGGRRGCGAARFRTHATARSQDAAADL